MIMSFAANLDPHERWCWSQQDGATVHTNRETIDFLTEFFSDRLLQSYIENQVIAFPIVAIETKIFRANCSPQII